MSTEDHDEGHHHHLPAVEDWPHGFGEASWWPFVTALGAAGIYIGAALFILAQSDIVPAITGPVAIIASTGLFLAGIYGWLYHAFIVNFWTRDTHERGALSLRWGMIAFLGSELGTFGAGFGYYFVIRTGTWPPHHMPELVSSLVLANTALLIASSFTLHWAHEQIRENNRRKFLMGLGATLVLGIVFLGGQVLEYYEFIVAHEPGFTLTTGIFANVFFGLTGLHGLHVTLGAVILAIVFLRGLRGQYNAERHVSVTTASMYWHFVDIVWIFLVVVLYVGAAVGT